ncbi:MAG: ABC transporter permease [Clostridiales bacterium]
MNIILAGTINETQKIISKKKNLIVLFLILSIVLISAIINIVSNNFLGANVINSAKLPITVLDFTMALVIPIFIFMITSDLFANEISNSTIIISLVRPVSRFKVYITKLISVSVFIITILASMFISSFIVSMFSGKISEVFGELLINLYTYIAAILPLIMLITITAFIAQFLKSSSGTVVFMVIGFLLLPVISALVPEFSVILPTSYIDWYQNFSYSSINVYTITNEFMFIVGYVIIFLSLGVYLFERKDI